MWAFGFTSVAILIFVGGKGWGPRRSLILVTLGFWSLRLGTFLYRRIRTHHPHEDGRYLDLRTKYKTRVEKGFFWFFQMQAASVVLLSVPFLMMSQNEQQSLSPFEVIGFIVWIFSLIGESVADAQMARFKRNPAHKGQTCEEGLWAYSRHPNYFFESCIWWGFYLMALGTPGTWFTVYCPLVILMLLLKVTGVPLAEIQSLKSRGDQYRDYQRRVSVFVPWFPRS